MESIKLSDLGLESAENWPTQASQYLDFYILSLSDIPCLGCDGSYAIVVSCLTPKFPGDIHYFCLQCFDAKTYSSLSMNYQSLMADRYKSMYENGIDRTSQSFGYFVRSLVSNLTPLAISENSRAFEVGDVPKGASDAPIPSGYRTISWIRGYEADAIIYAHKSKKNYELKNSEGEMIFQCRFYPEDSEEYRKFKANVQAIRVSNTNHRVIGWIRLEEARAIVEAVRLRMDVDFQHLKIGNGGKVQFFSEELEVAKKYRSTTRLLRKD
jgi:hypothetical protein